VVNHLKEQNHRVCVCVCVCMCVCVCVCVWCMVNHLLRGTHCLLVFSSSSCYKSSQFVDTYTSTPIHTQTSTSLHLFYFSLLSPSFHVVHKNSLFFSYSPRTHLVTHTHPLMFTRTLTHSLIHTYIHTHFQLLPRPTGTTYAGSYCEKFSHRAEQNIENGCIASRNISSRVRACVCVRSSSSVALLFDDDDEPTVVGVCCFFSSRRYVWIAVARRREASRNRHVVSARTNIHTYTCTCTR
jgi:hypothetical protein